MDKEQAYLIMFTNYPDILNVDDLSKVLGTSKKMIYSLLKRGTIKHIKIGREYGIPKIHLISYLLIRDEKSKSLR